MTVFWVVCVVVSSLDRNFESNFTGGLISAGKVVRKINWESKTLFYERNIKEKIRKEEGGKRESLVFPVKFKFLSSYKYMIKQKAIPLQAWTGPEGSRRLRLPDFKTIDI